MQSSCIHDVINALTSKIIYDRGVKYPTGGEPPIAKVATPLQKAWVRALYTGSSHT